MSMVSIEPSLIRTVGRDCFSDTPKREKVSVG